MYREAVARRTEQAWSSGYDARLTRERSRVRNPVPVLLIIYLF